MSTVSSLTMGRRYAASFAGLLLLLCCDSGATPGPTGPIIGSLLLSPFPTRMLPGDTATLQWTIRDRDGKALPGTSVDVTSSAPNVLSVSASGRVTAVDTGNATVTARAGGVSASTKVEVLSLEVAADVKVFPMALDTGQAVPTTMIVLNAVGNTLQNKPATYASASPDVATVSSSGVVQGVGFGQTTVQVTVDTVVRTYGVVVKPWPQQPDGFTKETERDFSKLATSASDTAGLDGWDAHEESQFPGLSIVQDPQAPHSPPGILQAAYAAGTQGGTTGATPGRLQRAFGTTPTWAYLSVWVELSANWYAHHTGTNKVLYVWINGQPRFFVSAEGPVATNLVPAGRLQGTPDDVQRNRETLMPNAHTTRIVPGKWQRWEILLKSNTPGQRDGEFHLWLDGLEVSRYLDVAYLAAGEPTGWTLVDIEPIWGGAGDPHPAPPTLRVGHREVGRPEESPAMTSSSRGTASGRSSTKQVPSAPVRSTHRVPDMRRARRTHRSRPSPVHTSPPTDAAARSRATLAPVFTSRAIDSGRPVPVSRTTNRAPPSSRVMPTTSTYPRSVNLRPFVTKFRSTRVSAVGWPTSVKRGGITTRNASPFSSASGRTRALIVSTHSLTWKRTGSGSMSVWAPRARSRTLLTRPCIASAAP